MTGRPAERKADVGRNRTPAAPYEAVAGTVDGIDNAAIEVREVGAKLPPDFH